MVEVDLTVLVATGVAASVAIAAIANCASSNKSSSSQKKQPKKKQETKREKEAPAKAPKATPVPATSKAPVVTTAPASSPKTTPVAAPSPAAVVSSDASAEEKKGKKAKETPEQRAARLERQRIAKLKKAEEEAAAAAQTEVQVVQKVSAASPPPAAAPAADGWEVVADKRKAKPKKVQAPATPVAVAADVATGGAVPTAVDQTTGTLKVEPKKVGALIGPKGATMHTIQDLTETKITMPKTERDATAAATVSVVGTAEGVAKAISIMKELCNKGYAVALEGENFQESSISVHNK
jgi:hypothetical protein